MRGDSASTPSASPKPDWAMIGAIAEVVVGCERNAPFETFAATNRETQGSSGRAKGGFGLALRRAGEPEA